MNAEEASRERVDRSNSFLCSLFDRSKIKIKRSNAVNAQQECDRDAVTLQRTPRGLSASAVDLYTVIICVT